MVIVNATWKDKLLTLFQKKVTKLLSKMINKKHGKICNNMRPKLKIFRAFIILVSEILKNYENHITTFFSCPEKKIGLHMKQVEKK